MIDKEHYASADIADRVKQVGVRICLLFVFSCYVGIFTTVNLLVIGFT